jgi:hypothetical protein
MIRLERRYGREVLLPANAFGWLGDHLAQAAESLLRPRAWWRPREEPERTIIATITLVLVVLLGLAAAILTLAGWAVVAVRLAAEWVQEWWERRQPVGRPVPARGWRVKAARG